jgi:hypothetical protein
MASSEVLGALQRLTVDVLSGGFGHVGDGGHGTHIGRLSDGSGCMRVSITAELLLCRSQPNSSRTPPAGWPVTSHPCDPGMKRDLTHTHFVGRSASVARDARTQVQ